MDKGIAIFTLRFILLVGIYALSALFFSWLIDYKMDTKTTLLLGSVIGSMFNIYFEFRE